MVGSMGYKTKQVIRNIYHPRKPKAVKKSLLPSSLKSVSYSFHWQIIVFLNTIAMKPMYYKL